MLYALIIILALVLIYLAITIPYLTIELNYSDYILTAKIKHYLYEKNIKKDFGTTKVNQDSQENNIDDINDTGEQEEKNDMSSTIKDKIVLIKDRIYNKEKGFDLDELKAVINEYTSAYKKVLMIIKKFLGKLRFKIHISKLYINLEYGTDNAAATGMLYGSAWGVIGLIYPHLARYFHIVFPSFDITPDFYNKRFDIKLKSIIKVRPAHIIHAILTSLLIPVLIYLINKNKKGSEQNGR